MTNNKRMLNALLFGYVTVTCGIMNTMFVISTSGPTCTDTGGTTPWKESGTETESNAGSYCRKTLAQFSA